MNLKSWIIHILVSAQSSHFGCYLPWELNSDVARLQSSIAEELYKLLSLPICKFSIALSAKTLHYCISANGIIKTMIGSLLNTYHHYGQNEY